VFQHRGGTPPINCRKMLTVSQIWGPRQGLKELGYIEGQNIVVDYRFAEVRVDRLADLVGELVQLRPDVLIAQGDFAARAISRVTTTIPVVLMTGDPVGAGYVAGLARPGGNITGVSMMQGLEGLTGKRVELLRDALPAATQIGLMFNPDNPATVKSLSQAEEVASRLGLVIRPFPARPGDEIEATIQPCLSPAAKGSWQRLNGTLVNFARASGSSSPTWCGRPSASSPSTTIAAPASSTSKRARARSTGPGCHPPSSAAVC
jgi:ABC transporter substrate binding protein